MKAVASGVEYDSAEGGYAPNFTTLKAVSTEGKELEHTMVDGKYSYYGAKSGCLYKTNNGTSFSNMLTTEPQEGETYYSYFRLDSIDGNLNIEEDLVDIRIPGYDVEYIDSYERDMGFTSLVVYSVTKMAEAPVYVGGVGMYDGDYLAVGATKTTTTKPSGGYAYYKDGVLTLNGYDNEKAHFIFEELALELYLVGDNTIGAIYDNEWGMAGGNLETRQGNLVIDAADGGKLTIASNPLDAYANIQVKDLYFNGGELTSCLANGTYGAAVQLNGGNLYLEDGYVAYVSDTNDFASATKWDGATDISTYDCVWIVDEQATVTHTVTFKVDTTTVATKTVEDGKTVTAPADPTQSGKTFLGWYTDGGTKFDFTTPITGDITLTAKFEDATSTVKLGDVDGNGKINMGDVTAIRKYLIDATSYPLPVPEAADVTGEGKINMADVTAIRKYLINSSLYPLA